MKLLIENWREFALDEGKAEDLIEKFPELQPAYDAGIRNAQYLNWMRKRSSGEPIEDIIGVIQQFDKDKVRLKAKGKSSDIYSYKDAALLRQALEDIGVSRAEKERGVEEEETTFLGKFGDWTVAMPHTTQSSCQLGKGTTWCTASTRSANAFMQYVEQPEVILIYLIRKGADPRKDPTAKLSVGFVKGAPQLDGQDGGFSVDAVNDGLTKKRLKEILGSQYRPIMRAMQAQVKKMGGVHPARPEAEKRKAREKAEREAKQARERAYRKKKEEELQALANRGAKNMDLHQKNMAEVLGWSHAAGPWFNIYATKVIQSDPIPEVFNSIIEDLHPASDTLSAIAGDPNTAPEILHRLVVRSQEFSGYTQIPYEAARNRSTSPETLVLLSDPNVSDSIARAAVARNKATPLKTLIALVDDVSYNVGEALTFRRDLPKNVLMRLANHKGVDVRKSLVRHAGSDHPEILIKLASDEDHKVRFEVAASMYAPVEALKILVDDPEPRVELAARGNQNYTMLGRAGASVSDLYKRMFKEEIEAVLRERSDMRARIK